MLTLLGIKLDPLRLAAIGAIIVGIAIAGWVVSAPLRAKHANHTEAAKVAAKVDKVVIPATKEVEKQNEVVVKKAQVRAVRVERAKAKVRALGPSAPERDYYREFLDGVCGTGLYDGDPKCGR